MIDSLYIILASGDIVKKDDECLSFINKKKKYVKVPEDLIGLHVSHKDKKNSLFRRKVEKGTNWTTFVTNAAK